MLACLLAGGGGALQGQVHLWGQGGCGVGCCSPFSCHAAWGQELTSVSSRAACGARSSAGLLQVLLPDGALAEGVPIHRGVLESCEHIS